MGDLGYCNSPAFIAINDLGYSTMRIMRGVMYHTKCDKIVRHRPSSANTKKCGAWSRTMMRKSLPAASLCCVALKSAS
eukprot:scaffold22009_cov38-Attheya_sp.AAC.1